ncbi:MAG: hypothetical protein AAGA91_21110, partial [Pseudomonadota bacterium]
EYFQGESLTPETQCPTTDTGRVVIGPTGPTRELVIDCYGFEMTKSPEWSGRASYTHTFPLPNGAELDAQVDVNYTDERWLTANFLEGQRVDSFTFWNAQLAYFQTDLNFSVTAYIRNITDEESFQVSLNQTQVPEFVGLVPGPPRTYGLRVRYDF